MSATNGPENQLLPKAKVKCIGCRGSGQIYHRSVCRACRGHGVRFRTVWDTEIATCGDCGGHRQGPSGEPCRSCRGAGTATEHIPRQIPDGACPACDGKPVSEWFAECLLCEGSGKISARLRRQLRLKRLGLALVKVVATVILIWLLLGAFVYWTEQL